MSDDTALLLGGPRDAEVVSIDGPAICISFPRIRDDGAHVMDTYLHAGTRLHGEKLPYQYEGEELPPVTDAALLARTRRERFGDFRAVLRELLADLRGKP